MAAALYDTTIGRDRLVRETAKALLVIRARSANGQPLGPDAPAVWLPKRHARWQPARAGAPETLHAPMWLCQEKGL